MNGLFGQDVMMLMDQNNKTKQDTRFPMNFIVIIVALVPIATSVQGITSFTHPSVGEQPQSCAENLPASTSIYRVALSDYIGYSVTIQWQDPSRPSFQLDKDGIEWALKSPAVEKIDRESTSNFTFVFNATETASGSSIPSEMLTLIITDLNDNYPQFTNDSYELTINDSLTEGTILTIQSTDADESPTITYSITAGDKAFSIHPKTGQLNLTTHSHLNATTTPTYNLTVQASDGTNVNYTTVIIHVVDDLCVPSPCANNGTCSRNNMHYKCTCTAGWLGDKCKEAYVVDPCSSSPCLNGSTCNRTGTNNTCDSPMGELKNDSELVDPCFSHPCKKGGVCVVNGTTFTCTCTSGLRGSNCNASGPTTSKSIVDPCICNPCANGGTCMVNGSSFSCLCVSGMTGNTCSTVVATAVSQTSHTDTQDQESNLLAVYIVVPVLALSGILIATTVFHKYTKRQNKVDSDMREGPRNQSFASSNVPNKELLRHNGPHLPPLNISNKTFLTTQ